MKKINFLILIITTTLVFTFCKSKKETVSTSQNKPLEANTKQGNVIVDIVEGLNLGNKAPDFSQNNTLNQPIKLSSFKGKIVLIDFWASWCGPCRKENPNVVATYNKYHNSDFKNATGFEIINVSLDQSKEAWLKAIEKDGLIWPYHVSDLQSWGNAVAKQYDVNSIPTNYLIDGNGIIIAKGLHGNELPNKIQLLLK